MPAAARHAAAMPSHVTILAAGTRGDVQPYIALAVGLIGGGHDVTLGANTEFRSLIESHRVPFHPLRVDYLAFAETPEGSRALSGHPLIATTVTGYWPLPPAPGWTADPALERFLAAGAPPVYVGFGSMPLTDPERTAREVVAGLRSIGARGLLDPSRLDARRVAGAVSQALAEPIAARAAELGRALRREDGVGTAAALLDGAIAPVRIAA
jgi:UDP:flavonoid glycosyltransferase YjiC (YdhE family)